MTFDKQLKEAKAKQLENRIIRDVVFLMLGLVFLGISIAFAIKDEKEKEELKNKKITTTNVINK